MNKKIWMIVSLMLLAILALLYILLKPDQLDQHYNSVVYSYETGFVTSTSVKLEGELYHGLLSTNRFIGHMTVDNDLKYKITLEESDQQYLGLITVFDATKSIRTIGSVVFSHELDKVWIKLDEMNQRYELKDGYISGPANNLEEAQQIAREVMTGDGKGQVVDKD